MEPKTGRKSCKLLMGMVDWISKYVDISTGIPACKTLKRVMSLIPTKSLERLLQCIRSSVLDSVGDTIERKFVEMDP